MRSCITMFSFRKRKREFDESMDHYRKMCKQRIEKEYARNGRRIHVNNSYNAE